MRDRRRRHLKAWEFWGQLLPVIVIVACVPLSIVAALAGWAEPLEVGVAAIGFMMFLACIGAVATVKAQSYAEDHDYCFCEHCCYALKDLNESGVCPECGEYYIKEVAKRYWWLRYNRHLEESGGE